MQRGVPEALPRPRRQEEKKVCPSNGGRVLIFTNNIFLLYFLSSYHVKGFLAFTPSLMYFQNCDYVLTLYLI